MLTSTAKLKEPIGVLGSRLLAFRDTSVEFGVRKFHAYESIWPADQLEDTGFWSITSGPLAGCVIADELLNFDLE